MTSLPKRPGVRLSGFNPPALTRRMAVENGPRRNNSAQQSFA
jgi:hypothetical protein